MFDRKQAKKQAKENVKRHYIIFVISCLVAAFIGVGYRSSLSAVSKTGLLANIGNLIFNNNVINDILSGNVKAGEILADNIIKTNADKVSYIGNIQLGHSKGVLSGVVNSITSGQFLIIIFNTINSIVKSSTTTTALMIAGAGLIVLLVTIFVKDTYKVAYRRVFLEGYKYKYVKVSRFLFLYRVRRSIKVSITIFVMEIKQLLWNLTIVGGIIKRYQYFMVPYIVAENPDIGIRKATDLSIRMMYGHKMECFKLELSMLGWAVLGVCTLGLSEILFSNPYMECLFVEYYAYLRDEAKKNAISYSWLLNDKYLFEYVDVGEVEDVYSDVVDIMIDDVDVRDLRHEGTRGFVENNLGVIYKYDEEEDKYNEAVEQEEKISEYRNILDLEQYPARLFPIDVEEKNTRVEQVHYLRHYSIWSLIAMFFIFCFIGYSWEVLLHIIEDGVFVNRGTMHGPWLPIYGSGGVMIVMVLFRFRNKPGLEAILTIILCGVVEYYTHWFLEITRGIKWWDYSGYFLNINGRICAEGLLVFMLGGMAIVYILAPMIDNVLRKVNRKVLKVICCILLITFACDMIYSIKVPNTGAGITDYGESQITQEQ